MSEFQKLLSSISAVEKNSIERDQRLGKIIDQHANAINTISKQTNTIIDEKRASQIIDNLLKINSEQSKTANNYNSVIFTLGHLGYFTIFDKIESSMNETIRLTCLIFIIISASTYIFFEIYKMIFTQSQLLRHKEIYDKLEQNKEIGSMAIEEKLVEFDKLIQKTSLKLIPIWKFGFYPALIFGILAIAVVFIHLLDKTTINLTS